MDWANERYARAYVRDTADYLALSWQARGLWWELLRKPDRAGVIATNHGARGLAALVRWPLEVVEQALPELLADGCIKAFDGGYVIPNYLDAQESTSSGAQRQRESRERRRLQAVTNRDEDVTERQQNVTPGHTESRAVTPSRTVPYRAEPSYPDLDRAATPPQDSPGLTELKAKVDKATRKQRSIAMPDGWQPRDDERRKASEIGVDCDAQVEKFRDYHTAKGSRFVNWDAAFRTWLGNAKGFARHAPARNQPTPLEQQLERVRMLEAEEARKAVS